MRLQVLIPALAALAGRTCAQGIVELLQGQADLTELAGLVVDNLDLVAALAAAENITIFAPINAAFAGLPTLEPDFVTAVLTYHVVQGRFASDAFTDDNQFLPTFLRDNADFVNITAGQVLKAKLDESGVLINDDFIVSLSGNNVEAEATVTVADITFDNGVVHLIDSLLLPPTDIGTTLATAQNADAQTSELLNVLGNYPELLAALAGLSDVTVFAPSNAAFAAANLTGLTSEQIQDILRYHVISGTVAYSVALESGNVTTLQGSDVAITVSDSGVMVNDNNVILADVLTASGVIHVIDGILIPTAPGNVTDPDPTDPDTDDDDEDEDDDDQAETPTAGASTLSSTAAAVVAGFLMVMAL